MSAQIAPTLIPSMMCWKSSTKLGSTPQVARGGQGGYFFGCSPSGTPWGCPVVAADCALLVEPTAGVRVVVGVAPDAGFGAVFPSGRAAVPEGCASATFTPSG